MRPFSNAGRKAGLEANARKRAAAYHAKRRSSHVLLRDIGFMVLLLAIAGVLMAWAAPWIEAVVSRVMR